MEERHVVVIGGGVAGAACLEALVGLRKQMAARDAHTPPPVRVRISIVSASPMLKRATNEVRLSRALSEFDVELRQGAELVRTEYAGDAQWLCAAAQRLVVQADGRKYLEVLGLGEPGLHDKKQRRDRTCKMARAPQIAKVPFDYCCIATGARPVVPSCLQHPDIQRRVHVIRDLDSIHAFRNVLSGVSRMAVVGNGGIALELVHATRNCEIAWIVRDTHIGNAFFDAEVAQYLIDNRRLDSDGSGDEENADLHARRKDRRESKVQQSPTSGDIYGAAVGPDWLGGSDSVLHGGWKKRPCLAAAGVSESTGGRPLRIYYDSHVLSAEQTHDGQVCLTLSEGREKVMCDVVVAATGVVPCTSSDPGYLEVCCERGAPPLVRDHEGAIVVEPGSLVTSVPGIYAAGDCSRVNTNSLSAESNWFQMRLWSQARKAGHCAAQSIYTAIQREFPEHIPDAAHLASGLEFELFAHATQFFGRRVVLLGLYGAQNLSSRAYMIKNERSVLDVEQMGGGEGEGKEGDNDGSGGDEEAEQKSPFFVRVVLQDGVMRGALLVGETGREETYENLILSRFPVENFGNQLVDPSFDLADIFD
ncbi:Pyridine nucleotide-disulfide oxidoreductase domain-containing protein 1 [Porphyridium purpureum]|uniref:Pyridine nucleotide-disulfide oxidoreductase domain-containing protein 1 n=1 Tax=Porphyridium purpureum TaxID=35688 RepID=A0A5J4YY23_PORPP|nr:Pyridine nucleotide-disulfide oxidoreductase domain-containing protein 1 [Porphyridium purpureum]|eukprot:POR6334..scf209_3